MRFALRLPLLMSVGALLLGVVFASIVHVIVTDMTQMSARDEATQQLRVAERALTWTESLPPGAVLDDPATPSALASAAEGLADDQTLTLRVDEPAVMWAARQVDGKMLAVQVEWTQWRRLARQVDRALAITVGGITVASGVAGMLIARRMSGRLGRAERMASSIAAGESQGSVGAVVGGHDEVASLARTIDRLQDAMQKRLDVEKRVTADIAHDLRTPITGLVTAARLLDDADPMTSLVRAQSVKLWRLTEDLLEVARLDHADQHLDVLEMTTLELARTVRESLPRDHATRVRIVGDGAHVDTDPRRVQRVLANLVGNALTHGAGEVDIECTGTSIAVRDHGVGFPPSLLATGPQRFRTGSGARSAGHGLGLTIAVGQARAIGADLHFANCPGGGARATLTFPPDPVPDRVRDQPCARNTS